MTIRKRNEENPFTVLSKKKKILRNKFTQGGERSYTENCKQTPNSQCSPQKEEQTWKHHTPDFNLFTEL